MEFDRKVLTSYGAKAGAALFVTLKDGVAELGKEEKLRVVDLAEIVADGL
jgi:hypothetical protein